MDDLEAGIDVVNCCALTKLWTVSFISWMSKLGHSVVLNSTALQPVQPKFELRTTLEAEHWHRNAFNLTVATWKQVWPHNHTPTVPLSPSRHNNAAWTLIPDQLLMC